MLVCCLKKGELLERFVREKVYRSGAIVGWWKKFVEN